MKNKYVASTLAFVLGIYGVHRFYLGQRFRGVIQFGIGVFALMITIFEHEPLIIIPALVALIDAVLLLVMPKAEFDEKHNKKYLAFTRPRRQAAYQQRPHEYNEYDYSKPAREKRQNGTKRTGNPYKSSGVAKFNDYDYDGAIQDFKKALRHKYNDPSLHFNLACCYSINELATESFFHLDKAVSFGFVDFDKIQKHNALAFVRTEDQFDEFIKNGYRMTPVSAEESLNIDLSQHQPMQAMQTPKAPKPTPAPTEDLLEQIVKLGELREKGILTDEEFQAQKQKLMRDN